jgi:transposase
MAALALAWHTFGTKKQREGITIGDIAKEFGLTAKVVSDAKAKINNQAKALHDRAVGSLDQRFKEGELVDWE